MPNNRPTKEDVYFHVARAVAQRASCPRKQVGAVAVRDGHILATGYNGTPRGSLHCLERESEEAHFARDHCPWAIHAETNCIAMAARHGISLEGATVYSTLEPCIQCEGLMANAGITTIRYLEAYKKTHPESNHNPTPRIDE